MVGGDSRVTLNVLKGDLKGADAEPISTFYDPYIERINSLLDYFDLIIPKFIDREWNDLADYVASNSNKNLDVCENFLTTMAYDEMDERQNNSPRLRYRPNNKLLSAII